MKNVHCQLSMLFAFATLTANAGLKDGLIFYEDCNDMKSPHAGVRISSSIRVAPGKFDKALRIERRTINSLANGDFKVKESDAWLYRDNAVWQRKGGIKNSSCLKIDGGEVVIPLVGLKPKYGNAFSFYAKNATPGKAATVSVIYEASGKDKVIVKDMKLTDKFIRVKAPFVAGAEEGSLRISVEGAIIIDNAQLDKGVTFFNTYQPPLKKRNVDRIAVPANGKYFSEKSGTINCWVKGPWVDPDMIGRTCALIGVQNAPKKVKNWRSSKVMFVSCIPKPKAGGQNGALHFITIDDKSRVAGLTERNLAKLPPLPKDEWRMFSFTWDFKEGKMHQVMYVDGKKLFGKSKPFGPLKKPVSIAIGFVGGSYLNGLLDDFAIYNRPLSPEEIETIYSSGKPLGSIIK